ncbi:MAG: efflux RND transporter periplasmic adaptor subunit [Opitutus sp.]
MSATKGNFLLKTGIVLLLAAVVAAAVLLGLRETALVAEVKRGPAVHAVSGSVEVHADHGLTPIKADVGGRVVWVSESLDPGKSFMKGEPLVRLDSRELQRKIDDARRRHKAAVERRAIVRENSPELQVAKKYLGDLERLQSRGEVADEDVNRQRRAVADIEVRLRLADFDEAREAEAFESAMAASEELLEKMTIRAPADGSTQSVFVTEGSLMDGGATVATYYHNERVVMAKIGEESFGELRLGQAARVRLLIHGSQEFDATVSKILPFGEEQTQRYTVWLDVNIPDEKLIPNSTGEVTITVGERADQPLVPRRAVINNEHVWVVRNGRVEKRPVEIGFQGLNLSEVRRGLSPGELVIVENLERFRDGQRVIVTRAD